MKIPPRPGPGWRFNAPPGWPPVPDGWEPTEGWGGPDPSWPPAPPYWSWWLEDSENPAPTSLVSGVGPVSQPQVATPVKAPRWSVLKPALIGAGVGALLLTVVVAVFGGGLGEMSGTSVRVGDSTTLESETRTPDRDPNATVVVDKNFQPATTRTETVWVEGDCLTVTSWGNCFQRKRVPVHQRVPVPERYFLVIQKGTAGKSRTEVDAFSYQKCAPGDEWPACRDGD